MRLAREALLDAFVLNAINENPHSENARRRRWELLEEPVRGSGVRESTQFRDKKYHTSTGQDTVALLSGTILLRSAWRQSVAEASFHSAKQPSNIVRTRRRLVMKSNLRAIDIGLE